MKAGFLTPRSPRSERGYEEVIFNFGFLILDYWRVGMHECGFKVGSLGSGGISEAASLVVEKSTFYVAAFEDPAVAGTAHAKDTEDVPTFPRMWECVGG